MQSLQGRIVQNKLVYKWLFLVSWFFPFWCSSLLPVIIQILQVLEREQIINTFLEVTARLEQALSGISFEKLDISDEVKEQVAIIPSFLCSLDFLMGIVNIPYSYLHIFNK